VELSRQQRKQLQDALIAAFPSKSSIEQMLSHQLDENLDASAGGGNLEEIVFNLIKTIESQGWIEKLVRAACNENPGNSKLKAIAERLLMQTASLKGLERANNALKRLGKSEDEFAKSSRLSIKAVTNFFQFQPIQLNSFKRICQLLELNWKEVAEMSEEERSPMVPFLRFWLWSIFFAKSSVFSSTFFQCSPQLQKCRMPRPIGKSKVKSQKSKIYLFSFSLVVTIDLAIILINCLS
jgi:Effector-associated domain 1